MKCVVAMMQHETNTFSPLPTPLSAFASGVGLSTPPEGLQAIDIYGNADFAFAGLIEVAIRQGAEIEVPVAAYAEPSGKVHDSAFESITQKICSAVSRGCDAVLLDLHGAMVTKTYDDGEGELLRRIREIDKEVPIAVALDFHTNLTAHMVENCTVIDGYRTYPHVDMRDTGIRAATTLFQIINENIKTRMVWRALPMMTHMIRQTPSQPPMKSIMESTIHLVEQGQALNASVFGGFPLADIEHLSLSVLVVEREGESRNQKALDKIARSAWQSRLDFVFEAEPLSESIHRASQLQEFPVVIADHGDNSGAGGSMDDMTVIKEMLNQGLDDIVAGPIWDPDAVAAMVKAGQGVTIKVEIGGKTDVPTIAQQGSGLWTTGKVECITDGQFTIQGPMQTGLSVSLGRSVLFDIGTAKILVCEERWEPYDPGCFRQAGVDVERFKYIVIKSRQHFRATFEKIAKHIVLAAGPGVCSSDYSQFSFENIRRPIYPLDPDMKLSQFEESSKSGDVL